MKKKLLLILSMVLVFVALFAFSASAAENPEFNSDSYFKPVDYDTHKSISKVTLYGNADYICMKAYSETNKEEIFNLEIYSDSKYKKRVAYYTATFKKGKTYEDIFFDLTGLGSGTYYAKAFVQKEPVLLEGYLSVDPDTVVKFKVSIKRGGASSIKKMKAVMYGYENTEVGPAIYWYSIPNAEGYYIYRYEDKKYKKIATVKATGDDFGYYIDKSYKDKNATRKYKIRAYNDEGKTGYSENYVKAYILKTPKVKVSVSSGDRVKISWNSVKKSAEYAVLRRTKNSAWELVEETSSTYCYDYSAKNNTVYYYTVIAGTNTAVSGYDTTGAKIRFLKAPKINSPEVNESGLVLNWTAVSGADSYAVYRKAKESDSWKKLTTVKNTTYVDTTVQKNTIYFYTVKAIKDGREGSYKGKGVSGGFFDTPKLNEVTYNAEGYPVLSWSTVENCSRYNILKKAKGETEWQYVKETSGTSLVLGNEFSFNSGTEYTFTVRGYITDYDVFTPYDATGVTLTYYNNLSGVDVIPIQNGLTVKWNAVSGADKYAVYRKTADTEYTLLGTTDQTSYNDETVEKDVKYTYKITYFCGELELEDYGCEKDFTVVDNNIKLETNQLLSVSSNYCNIKLYDYDADSTYYVYLKNGDTFTLNNARPTSNGRIPLYKSGESNKEEYIITSVSKDGVVSGFENAQVITAEYFSVTGLTATPNHVNETVTLSWDAVEGAEKCEIYNETELLATVTGTTTYTLKQQASKFSTLYHVRIIKNNHYAQSEQISVRIMTPPVVSVINLETATYVCWNAEGSSHILYRREEGESSWKAIKTFENSNRSIINYTDESVKPGKTYYYTVKAIDGKGYYSNYDKTGAKITFMLPVEISSFKTGGGKITIKWKKTAGAKSYKIYKCKTNGGWKLLKTVKASESRTYVDKNVKKGKQYDYFIIAVNGSSESARNETPLWFTSAPKLVSATATSKGITVKFEPVKGATGYTIYRKTKNGSWKQIANVNTSKTKYVDKKAKKGVKYTYTVCAKKGAYSSPYNTKGVSAKRK